MPCTRCVRVDVRVEIKVEVRVEVRVFRMILESIRAMFVRISVAAANYPSNR